MPIRKALEMISSTHDVCNITSFSIYAVILWLETYLIKILTSIKAAGVKFFTGAMTNGEIILMLSFLAMDQSCRSETHHPGHGSEQHTQLLKRRK